MADKRKKNVSWRVANDRGETRSWEAAQVAVLMDIRDELQEIKRVLSSSNTSLLSLRCVNFRNIPRKLDRIVRNTAPKKAPPKRRKFLVARGNITN